MNLKGLPLTLTIKFNDGREQALNKHLMSLQDSIKGDPKAVLDALEGHIDANVFMMTFKSSKIEIARKILAAQNPKPRVIVELGGYVGASAVAWAAMLREFHGGNDTSGLSGCKVYSCELDPNFAEITRQHVELAGLSDLVEVVEGESAASLRRLKAEGKLNTIDMLFLDHWEKYYVSDTQLCEELGLFRKGSLIIADNVDIPGAPAYLEYINAGGSGKPGSVKYKTKTYMAPESEPGPVCICRYINKKCTNWDHSERLSLP